jgi:hypothetical protein
MSLFRGTGTIRRTPPVPPSSLAHRPKTLPVPADTPVFASLLPGEPPPGGVAPSEEASTPCFRVSNRPKGELSHLVLAST